MKPTYKELENLKQELESARRHETSARETLIQYVEENRDLKNEILKLQQAVKALVELI